MPESPPKKLPYEKPELTSHGSVEVITLQPKTLQRTGGSLVSQVQPEPVLTS